MRREYWRYLPIVWPYVRRQKRLMGLAIVLLVIASVTALAEPWPLAFLVDGVLGKSHLPGWVTSLVGRRTGDLILFAVASGIFVTLVTGILSLLSEAVNTRLEQRLSLDHRSDLYAHCQTLTQAFYDHRRTGDFMYRINFEAEALGFISVALLPLAQNIFTLVGMFIVAATLDLRAALCATAVTPFIYYATGAYGKYIEPRLVNVRNLEGESLGIVNETMAILRLTVAFNRQPKEYWRFRKQGKRAVAARINVTVAQMVFSLVVSLCTASGVALVLYLGAHDVVRGKITVGELLVLFSYIIAVYNPLQHISSTMATFQEKFIALQKARELMSAQPEFVDAEDAHDLGRVEGRVTFEDVSFNYQSRVSTLRNISFDVTAGTTVAVVGPTGAGKSTLVGLIPRFFEVIEGRILVDDIDIRDVTQRSLREQIAIVPQDPVLFSGTVADNIRYGKLRATDEEIERAARAANAHEFIMALPGGYSSYVGERGVNLSGGERQRICIARAFVKDAPIVILDEPTSSIDSRTEAVILDALDRLGEGRTTFVIAHRLSTVRNATRILVLNNGELVEQGTPEELLGRDGLFRELHDLQLHEPPGPSATPGAELSTPRAVSRPPRHRPRVVVLGMMSKIPVAGVIWQTLHYLVGLERLGCDAYYVEAHARTPSMFMESESDDGAGRAAAFLARTLARFGLGDRWAYHALHDNGACYGLSLDALHRLYRDADLIVNLHGGTEPLPEHSQHGRLIYVETDPVQLQVELHDRRQATLDFLEPHAAFFTFGENIGRPGCLLPAPTGFDFSPTRQPVVMDFWASRGPGQGDKFTTIGNWRQEWRDVTLDGEIYRWSKHHEFLKVMNLPGRTSEQFELALGSCTPEDRRLLEDHGWAVRSAAEVSTDIDTYRDYISGSKGEFTVAKEQNVRLQTGWFSDRSATYLAAGRPVITHDTGFGDVLPTGQGLFAFSTEDEALAATEAVASDLRRHRTAAQQVAREFFAHDVVLRPMLGEAGLSLVVPRSRRPRTSPPAANAELPRDLVLSPVRRRPIQLADATVTEILSRPVPEPDDADRSLPRVASSIVVVTKDNLVFLRLCLESLLSATEGDGWEVLVVDNGSTDGTAGYVRDLGRRFPRVLLLPNEHNVGFPAAVNQGLAVARGDTLVILNDDTVLPRGWLRRLRRHLEDPLVGLVGPVTNAAANEARIDVAYSTYGEFVDHAAQRANEHDGEIVDIPVLTMFCVGMRRDAFERIGRLDEVYELGLFEDDDYAERARSLGLRVVCAEDVLVHHFGEASFGQLVPTGEYAGLFDANRRRFEAKWGREWATHQRRHEPVYEGVREAVRRLTLDATPAGATILMVSRGDERLITLTERTVRHFPGDGNGGWAGNHPADSSEAVRLLEAQRAGGARWLVLPRTSLWWLDHYDDFARHLERTARVAAVAEDAGRVLALDPPSPAPAEHLAGLRPPICVLGMHRSGTSMVTRVVNILGVDIGPAERMLEPDEFNPTGFWEHRDILDINDALLASRGGSWDAPPLLPPGWAASEDLAPLRERASAVLNRDFRDSSCWGWKDPRTCLTLPFWQLVAPEGRYVLCIRHPLAVARSLAHAMDRELAVRLWYRYVTSSLAQTVGSGRHVIVAERLVNDPPAGVGALASFLDLPGTDERRRLAEEAVTPAQWHHVPEAVTTDAGPQLAQATALYDALGEAGSDVDALDRLALDPTGLTTRTETGRG